MKRVLAALSGGVDSSVAAKLLLDRGCDVTGVTLKLFSNDDIRAESPDRTCCSLTDTEDARKVANLLSIPYYVMNFTGSFRSQVIEKFVKGYIDGETPNPCIDCNRTVKFSGLLSMARTMGFDCMATGHYAKIVYDPSTGRYLLMRPKDSSKDQTYVLYAMSQHQLSQTLFPLSDLCKEKVREIAVRCGLPNAKKPDSQDICFVRGHSYAAFIEDYTGLRMCGGNFVNQKGEIIGRHHGIARYTIGQRRGLSLSCGKPMYVTAKDACHNTVTLGNENDLYVKSLMVSNINLIPFEKLSGTLKATVKTRYGQSEAPAALIPLAEDKILVEFENPQRAAAKGQAAVFYDRDVVIGGGTIL